MPPRVWPAGSRVTAQPERRAKAAEGAIGEAPEGRACVLRRGEDSQGPLRKAGLRRETMASGTQGRLTEEPRRSSRAKQLHGEASRGSAKQDNGRCTARRQGQGPQDGRRPGDRAPEAALGEPAKSGKRREGHPKKGAETSTELKVPANLRGLHRQEGTLVTLDTLKVHTQVTEAGRGGRRRGRAPRARGPPGAGVVLPQVLTAVG